MHKGQGTGEFALAAASGNSAAYGLGIWLGEETYGSLS